jgi:dTDP-4-amino-4,6-dideoxygalactose transaminase
VLRVLQSGTWAISGERLQEQTQEQAFCREFADFVGMPYGVACSSGSTALTIALEAAGIGYGDRVLVPPSPWVACASAVVAIGGIPVFCDLEPDGLCMCPKQAESLLGTGIKAILLVHSNCAIADLPAFKALATKHGIPLVEDCSQAHGAIWQGQMVGSFGDFSVFSMQQSKVLTSGEGGVVLCKTGEQYEKLQQLRADGRVWQQLPGRHAIHLQNHGQMQGFNYCLSEMQSGLLRAGLKRLPEENRQRAENALLLNKLLQDLPEVRSHFRHDQNQQPAIYKYCVSIPAFPNRDMEETAQNLTRELGTQVFTFDSPIYRHPLYQPQHCRRFPPEHIEKLVRESQVILPEAEARTASTLRFPHRLFLGKAKSMVRICNALVKVMK